MTKTLFLKGIYRCTHCGNIEAQEREVSCWACGKGEMVWRSKEFITDAINAWASWNIRLGNFSGGISQAKPEASGSP